MTISPDLCSSCRTSLPIDAAFCPRCGVGTSAGRVTQSARRAPAWLAAAAAVGAVLLALGLVVWRGYAVPHASAAPLAEATPAAAPAVPDISGLSPKERFDRLYGRVMQALRSGDAATLSRFAPMALAAYNMIDSADADSVTRRRAALLRLHLGDTTAARAFESRAGPLPSGGEGVGR